MSPEGVAGALALIGAMLAAPLGYLGARAGGKATLAAAQEQSRATLKAAEEQTRATLAATREVNRGLSSQAATDARRAVYADFARVGRGLVDALHRYVMQPGPDVDADTAVYLAALDAARWEYDVVSIEGPPRVRDAAKAFIDQVLVCRAHGSGYASLVMAFGKLDELRLTDDGHHFEQVLEMEREMAAIRRAARNVPAGEWRHHAHIWASEPGVNVREQWREERDRNPEGAPAYEEVSALVDVLRDDDPHSAMEAAVQAGQLDRRDVSRIVSHVVKFPDHDPLGMVRATLIPASEGLEAFVKEAGRVLHPEEHIGDS
ncbi:hypothetical protein [Streptomyces sp. NPDC047525]|uniref:hypothetical protein n=1 Tax=Streptomyces sp. NPDC047525 TaxID=3155264 RepID=UPI0033EFED54